MLSEEDEDELVEEIYAGAIAVRNLPYGLFKKIEEDLTEGMVKGYGVAPEDLAEGTETHRIGKKLKGNVRVFSAAKTFQQVREMSEQVVDGAGNKRSFQEFEEIAKKTFDKYNREWLRTEQNTAFNQSRAAKNWARIEENKDLYPVLRYRTAGDDRVRDEHGSMEGITRPVDDSFWDTNYPPNGWNCRCPKPRQVRSGTSSDVRGVPEPPDLLKMNAGKDGMIFKEDVGDGIEHPYFKVDQRYEVLKQNGVGLL